MLAMTANYQDNGNTASLNRGATARSLRKVLQALPAARKEVEVLESLYQGYFGFDSLAFERIFL